MSNQFSRGCKPDSGRHTRGLFRGVLEPGDLPQSASLRAFIPEIMDQNGCGSCCAHAVSAGIFTSLFAAGSSSTFVASQRRLYGIARAIDRTLDGIPTSEPLVDNGTELLSVFKAASQWGIMASEAPVAGPYGALVNSDCVPKNVNEEPIFADLEKEATRLVVGPYEIVSTGERLVKRVMTSLAQNQPVAFAVLVGEQFERYTEGCPPIGAQNDTTPDDGHAMLCIGYEITPAGVIFDVLNSWGKSWGDKGLFRCTEEFVHQWLQVLVMSVEKVG